MNKTILIGRLTKDPEIKYTSGQMAVVSFTLAVDRIKKTEDKSADFIRCVAFSKLAENVQTFTHKGDLVGVEGSISTGQYTDKNGTTLYTTDILTDRVEFLERKKTETPAAVNPADLPF